MRGKRINRAFLKIEQEEKNEQKHGVVFVGHFDLSIWRVSGFTFWVSTDFHEALFDSLLTSQSQSHLRGFL